MGLYEDILKTQAEVDRSRNQGKPYETAQVVSSADAYHMSSGMPSMFNSLSQSQGRPINESGDIIK